MQMGRIQQELVMTSVLVMFNQFVWYLVWVWRQLRLSTIWSNFLTGSRSSRPFMKFILFITFSNGFKRLSRDKADALKLYHYYGTLSWCKELAKIEITSQDLVYLYQVPVSEAHFYMRFRYFIRECSTNCIILR